jgi:hypothetical protein
MKDNCNPCSIPPYFCEKTMPKEKILYRVRIPGLTKGWETTHATSRKSALGNIVSRKVPRSQINLTIHKLIKSQNFSIQEVKPKPEKPESKENQLGLFENKLNHALFGGTNGTRMGNIFT